MVNSDQSTLLYCCEDVKSHRSGGDTVPLSRKHARINEDVRVSDKTRIISDFFFLV